MKGLPRTYEGQMRLVERSSAEGWTHPNEEPQPDQRELLLETIEQWLTPVFEFLASGKESRTRGIRVWVVLYELRRPMINGETIAARAKKEGIDGKRIRTLLAEFREILSRHRAATPGRESPSRTG